MSNSIVILGAGLTGLGCAKSLPGARVFEAAPSPGGHVRSHNVGGVFFDEGAHICHSRDKAWLELIFRNAGEVNHFASSLVHNYWHGHWITYPAQNHLIDLPEPDRIRALTDLVHAQIRHRDDKPTNYHEWCIYQYGEFLTGQFYEDYTTKYWRVPMKDMGLDWLKGRLLPSEVDRIISGALSHKEESQSVFSSFHYPARGGFFSFFKPMYDGVPIACGERAVRVDPVARRVYFASGRVEDYEKLVSTMPLTDLVRMIDGAPRDVVDAAAGLRHTQLICVNMIVARPALSPSHWFYIYGQDTDASRVKVMSNLTPGAVPEGCTALQCEVFRRGDEVFDAEAIAEKTVKDMARLLKFDPKDVRALAPVCTSHAYPIADLGRQERVEHILAWLATKGIHSIGLFGRWKFIWSDAAYAGGLAAGREIASS